MKHYTNVAKGLKLKVRNLLGLIPTFVVVTGGKLLRRAFFVSQFRIFFRKVFKNGKLKTIKIKLKLEFIKIQILIQNTKTICKKTFERFEHKEMQKNKEILKTLGARYIHYIPCSIIKTVGCFKYKV